MSPLGFFTREEGFTYSTLTPMSPGSLKTPRCSSWSNLSESSTNFPLSYFGSLPFLCRGCTGPMLTAASNGPNLPLWHFIQSPKTSPYLVCNSVNFDLIAVSRISPGSALIPIDWLEATIGLQTTPITIARTSKDRVNRAQVTVSP